MGTMVSSQVLNMIIYILMVLQKPWLRAKKVGKTGETFFFVLSFFLHDVRRVNTWATREEQQRGSSEKGGMSNGLVLQPGSLFCWERHLPAPEDHSSKMGTKFPSFLPI